MNAKWAGMVVLTALGAGCGQGRAIFNVDVQSFLKPSGRDTVPYLVPPLTSAVGSTVQRINLPGVGSSIVDTVHAVGTARFINSGGSGTIQIQLYVATDSAGTYNASALAISLPPSSVPGPDVPIDADPVEHRQLGLHRLPTVGAGRSRGDEPRRDNALG